MDIEHFVKAKRELEQQLTILIRDEVAKFEQATGFTPQVIFVQMICNEQIGAPHKWVVGLVRVEVPIE